MQLWAAGHIGAEHEHEDRAGGGIPDIHHLEGGRGLAQVALELLDPVTGRRGLGFRRGKWLAHAAIILRLRGV